MLTSKRTRRVDIPGEEGEWAEIKPASLSDLEAARDTGLAALTAKMSGFAELLDLIPQDMQRAAEGPEGDYLAGTDILTLLSRCVRAWSYGAEITTETVGDLDEATARFLAEAIWPPKDEAEGKVA